MEIRDGFIFLYKYHNDRERRIYILNTMSKMDGLLKGLLHVYELKQWIKVLYGKLTVIQRITNFPTFLYINLRLINTTVSSSDYMS